MRWRDRRAATDPAWTAHGLGLRSALNAARRTVELDELAGGAPLDVLVVGGGITGAGAALDAALRGLRVALVERHDLAWGTSRFSSKMVHGGLRYLASGDVGVAVESAMERGRLIEVVAPHLVHALPQLIPLTTAASRRDAMLARAGLGAADLLRRAARTPRGTLPPPRRIGPEETLALAPCLRRDGLRGALLSWDGQLVDDARLVVAVARTAAAHGARVITRCDVERTGGGTATLRDTTGGGGLDVRARVVINATGVWAGGLSPSVRLRPSKGTHAVLRAARLRDPRAGITVAVPGERNRWVFTLPSGDGLVYVGLTDDPVDGDLPEVPAAAAGEIAFLIDTVGRVLDEPPHTADVVGAFSGLRPLLEGEGSRTADLSRSHRVVVDGDVVAIVGGKLTTYRRMAEDAVDTAVRVGGLEASPCRTRTAPLVGAAPRAELAALRLPSRLVQRYGVEARRLVEATGAGAQDPVPGGRGVTMAELAFGMTHEGALDADDLLDRRTRIGLVPEDRAAALEAAERAVETASGRVAAGPD